MASKKKPHTPEKHPRKKQHGEDWKQAFADEQAMLMRKPPKQTGKTMHSVTVPHEEGTGTVTTS